MSETKRRHTWARAAHRAALVFCAALFLVATPGDIVPASGTLPAMAKLARETVWLVITGDGGREISIDAEIAVTPEESSLGLMFRTELAETSGMLFPSPFAREMSMWMRNTYIPLDMVFIREDGVIHRIEAMTEPHSEAIITSRGDVKAVLELKGGAAAKFGLKPGDIVRHRTFGNAKR